MPVPVCEGVSLVSLAGNRPPKPTNRVTSVPDGSRFVAGRYGPHDDDRDTHTAVRVTVTRHSE